MKVRELIEKSLLKEVNIGDNLDEEITGVFCCDLLSIAMGRAPAGCAWVTVMGNINTLAVAALTETAIIILAEGTVLDEPALKKSAEQGITVLKSDEPVYETAAKIDRLIHIV